LFIHRSRNDISDGFNHRLIRDTQATDEAADNAPLFKKTGNLFAASMHDHQFIFVRNIGQLPGDRCEA
jgi:hypothetical protein